MSVRMINSIFPQSYSDLETRKSPFDPVSLNIVFVSVCQDWWNSTSFANYYRTWNVVVHDWLYYYGYRDFLWVSRLPEHDKNWCS